MGLVAPYMTLVLEDAGQREDTPREVPNKLCYVLEIGAPDARCENYLPALGGGLSGGAAPTSSWPLRGP